MLEHWWYTCNQTVGSMRPSLVPTLLAVCLLLYLEDQDNYDNRLAKAVLARRENHSI
jgi:hypothetical protein